MNGGFVMWVLRDKQYGIVSWYSTDNEYEQAVATINQICEQQSKLCDAPIKHWGK